MNRQKLLVIAAIIIAILLGILIFQTNKVAAPADQSDANSQTTQNKSSTAADIEAAFDKAQFSLSDPASIWVIANKQRKLQPAAYVPDDLVVPGVSFKSGITSDENRLRKVAAAALEELVGAAKKEGINLPMQSGYRSYNYQTALYGRYVREQGQAVADTQSARPGHSEHQTGLAVDLGGTTRPACNVEDCYKDTAEGKWIAANTYKYGFVVRYPEGKQPVTGYIYEPWHLRYVGSDLAAEIHRSGSPTLEEYFGLPAAPDYK